MKPEPPRDSFSDEFEFDGLFQVRDLAPSDFASRTLKAVQGHRRRARIYRFTAWAGAAAAAIAVFMGLTFFQTTSSEFQEVVASPTEAPETLSFPDRPAPFEVAAIRETGLSPDPAEPSAEELTALLHTAISESDTMFYSHAWELERLLAEATALSEEENLQTLDMLILFAQN